MAAIGNTQDLSNELWFRKFARGANINSNEPNPDEDTVATPEQLKTDFVDHWGQRLINDTAFRKLNTYNELIESFFKLDDVIVQTYVVADGQEIPVEKQKDWFRSELRLLSLIIPADKNHPKDAKAPITSVSWAPWFFLIASSSYIHSEVDILHVMSWSAEDGQFRFYARDVIMRNPTAPAGERGWIYLCSSMDAFDASGKAYMGPLNGHVNGALVMKEIHKPWLHWLVGGRGVMNLIGGPDSKLYQQLASADWLTYPGYPPLYGATVQSGETLERIVLDALRLWFASRRKKDFMNPDGITTNESPQHIQRWAAHFFLSTNINIIACPNSMNIVPSDFFFNYEMLRGYSDLLPNSRQQDPVWQKSQPYWGHSLEDYSKQNQIEPPLTPEQWYNDTYSIPKFEYNQPSYMLAARQLKLCTLQEVPPSCPEAITFKRDTLAGGVFMGTLMDGEEKIDGGEEISFAIQQWGEGDNPWVILQSSIEDAMGVWMAQKMFLGADKQKLGCKLFSDQTFNAIMMVDFCNPVYSWKRLRLMQYIPVTTKLEGPNKDPITGEEMYTFDLEKRFIAAIRDVHKAQGHDSKTTPESEFLSNLEKPLIAHQIRIMNYVNQVSSRLSKTEGVFNYMRLAESRRRMFRPLPMNFFGSNLPYCLAIHPEKPWVEMNMDGTVTPIPEIGLKFLHEWLGSLAGNDPNIIPLPDLVKDRESRMDQQKPGTQRKYLPKASTMRMACQRSIAITNPEIEARRGGCPFLTK